MYTVLSKPKADTNNSHPARPTKTKTGSSFNLFKNKVKVQATITEDYKQIQLKSNQLEKENYPIKKIISSKISPLSINKPTPRKRHSP